MKKQFKLGGIAALSLLGSLASMNAQTATTDPVGYVTVNLTGNGYNLVGLTLHEATEISGSFETVNGVQLTDDDVDFSTILEDDTSYILEITSGDASGLIQEITTTDVNTNVISTPDDLSDLGEGSISAGAEYKIRKAATISSIFGADNSAGLLEGTSIGASDVIWVQNGSGSFNKYFYHSGQTVPFPISEGWKSSTLTDVSTLPLIYTDGLMIETNDSSDKSLTLTGSVISQAKQMVVTEGFNLLGTVFPIGTTLSASGLENDLLGGTSLGTADVLWLSNESGGFDKYFYHTGQTVPFPISAGWKNSTLSDASTQEISGAIFIERQSGDTSITSTPSF
ncbi:hypothetical protein [Rubritalea sp.]|uniref:hypothetical protein n=1 Tax=Rubritalea sp. TaxID=2109375 RepID=UPI003EF3F8D9